MSVFDEVKEQEQVYSFVNQKWANVYLRARWGSRKGFWVSESM